MPTWLQKHNWVQTIILFVLAILSLLLIFSTTYTASNPQEGQGAVLRQIVFFVLGFSIYFALSSGDISWIKQKTTVSLLYVVILVALIGVLVFAPEINGTKRWILIGPLSFQPAEYAKLVLILLTSYIFTQNIDELGGLEQKWQENLWLKLLISTVLTSIFVMLIFLQPSLGNAILTGMIWLVLIFMVFPMNSDFMLGMFASFTGFLSYYSLIIFDNLRNISLLSDNEWKLFVVASFALLSAVLYKFFDFKLIPLLFVFFSLLVTGPLIDFGYQNILQPYHRERIDTYIEGFGADPRDSGYQVRQSLTAIGAGQLFGRGYLQGTQSSLQTLPFAHTDFIFAAHAEQFGLMGVIILFILYGLLFLNLIQTMLKLSDIFAKLVVTGVIALLAVNIFINIAMNMGLVPVTGVPLPLVSYGGSAVIVNLSALGLVQMAGNALKSKDVTEKFTWGP
ncbi:MAG: rod shape-determining protein RodA [Candidatus Dojkabacteria bacterium]